MKLWILTLLLAVLVGCKRQKANKDFGIPATTVADIQGTWLGTATDSRGSGSFAFTIAQNGTRLSGTYTTPNSSGLIEGTMGDKQLTFTAKRVNPSSCEGTIGGTGKLLGEQILLSYSGTDCLGAIDNGSGTVNRVMSGSMLDAVY